MNNLEINILNLMSNNYCYIIQRGDKAAIVDPGASLQILKYLEKNALYPVRILLTHNHEDHNGGVIQIRKEYPDTEVIESEMFAEDVVFDLLKMGHDEIAAFQTPGHTENGMCFYLPSEKVVFTGDTLFTGGCGRILGGNCEDLYRSINKILELPDDVTVLSGHEYLKDNIEFICSLSLPTTFYDELIEKEHQPSIATTIGNEKKNNPFARCDDSAFQEWLGIHNDPVKLFCELRKRKSEFF